jgi:hypothetical protein
VKNHKAVRRKRARRRHQVKKGRAGNKPDAGCVLVTNMDGSTRVRKRRK